MQARRSPWWGRGRLSLRAISTWAPSVVLVLTFGGCDGGGSGGGGPVVPDLVQVAIDQSRLPSEPAAGYIDLYGTATCDNCPPADDAFGYCPPIQPFQDSAIDIAWNNKTTGDTGSAVHGITGSCSCLFSYCFTVYSHKWWARVPVVIGENTIEVRAFKASGASGTDTVAITAMPAAPDGLVAVAGWGSVTLSWNSVPEATSYNLYWSTSSYVTRNTGTKIAGASSPYTHLVPGFGPIYYCVTAVSGTYESRESAVAGWATTVPDIIANNNGHAISFGSVRKNSSSARTVIVQNNGILDLTIGVIALDGTASPISIVGDACSHQSIASNGTCSFTIGFSPLTEGSYTNTVLVPSNDPDTPLVSLGVTGRAHTLDLPRTGQSVRLGYYDDGYAPSGVAWPDPRFTNNNDGTITDALTGLMWPANGNIMPARDASWDQDGTVDGRVSWQHALDYVNKLNSENYAGHSDWRLPNKKELRSIVNYGASSLYCPIAGGSALCETNAAWLNTVGFINIKADWYWSATTDASHANLAMFVDMSSGDMNAGDKAWANFVWPVRTGQQGVPAELARTGQATCYDTAGSAVDCAGTGQDGALQKGAAWPGTRFSTNADTTVTDILTGLIWAPNALTSDVTGSNSRCTGGGKTWQGALDYVTCLNTNAYLGHADWRLPNVNELESLVHAQATKEDCLGSPCTSNAAWLNTQGFNGVEDNYYWTSTAYVNRSTMPYSTKACSIGMGTYYAIWGANITSSPLYVWPVRSGQ